VVIIPSNEEPINLWDL